MYISEYLQSRVSAQPSMANDQFLQFAILQLQDIFCNEMIAIKNIELDYIAFSTPFAVEFSLAKEHLGTKGNHSMDESTKTTVLAQEQQIINEGKYQDFFCFYKKDDSTKTCTMRKRPLINPFTLQTVGLVTVVSNFGSGFMRKFLMRNLFPKPSKSSTIKSSTQLNESQQHIVFCLLAGFYSRHEIATIIQNAANIDFNETKIKNSLQALYQKLECSSTTQLLDLILDNWDGMHFPASLHANGTSYPIK